MRPICLVAPDFIRIEHPWTDLNKTHLRYQEPVDLMSGKFMLATDNEFCLDPDVVGMLGCFAELRRKAQARTGRSLPIIVVQEAGLDGFWIHRVLQAEGIESHIVDPASIATSRRRRRAKTDKLDGEALVRAFAGLQARRARVCAMLRVPTPDRRIVRERKALTNERIRHVNRVKGLLFGQGVSGYEPLRSDRRKRLEGLKTGDRRPLSPNLKAQISRELDRIELSLTRIKDVEEARDTMLESA